MSEERDTELASIGQKLAKAKAKEALMTLLPKAATMLEEVQQSPPSSTIFAMKACSDALVDPALLRHKDKDVGVLVALCISEIMRIVAPDAPYSDDCLKEIFQLIVDIFRGLDDVDSPFFSSRVNILETVAKVRSCVVMLDLECDDLITEMFRIFFTTASDKHPEHVFLAMRNVLSLVIEEGEEVSSQILEIILNNLLRQKEGVSEAGHKLAVAVVEKSADNLEPYVRSFLTLVILEGRGLQTGLKKDYHEIIYEIYSCAPQMLLDVLPYLKEELVSNQVTVRLKATMLLGRMFASPDRQVASGYQQLFSEFLKRLNDEDADVQIAAVNCAKACLETMNSSAVETSEILVALADQLLHFDDRVRISVMNIICDFARTNLNIPHGILQKVGDCLQDTKTSIGKETLLKLASVYRSYCTKSFKGFKAVHDEFEWIPSKILRCSYGKGAADDFKLLDPEIAIFEELFDADLPVEEQAKHWIAFFSLFDEQDKITLQHILSHKQRLQLEMVVYLSELRTAKEKDTPDFQKRLQSTFATIAQEFADPKKAEEDLKKLHDMSDVAVSKELSSLLDPSTTTAHAHTVRAELLKRMGEGHPQHNFLKTLATKCAYSVFSREHAYAFLQEILINKDSATKEQTISTLDLLGEVAAYCPTLMEDLKEKLELLAKDDKEFIRKGVLKIISTKAGSSFREGMAGSEVSSKLEATAEEEFCVQEVEDHSSRDILHKSLQQSSPKGRKQGQAVGDGEVLSEDEKEAVDDVNHKGGDHDNNVMAKGASGVETASLGKDPLEDEEEEEKEQEENVPEKRKRGRPKGSAKKKPSSGRTKTTGKMVGPKKMSVAVGMEHGEMEQDKNLPPQLECGQPEGSSNKKDGSDDVLEEAEKDGVEEREEEHHQVKNPEEDGMNNNNHEKDDTVKDVEDVMNAGKQDRVQEVHEDGMHDHELNHLQVRVKEKVQDIKEDSAEVQHNVVAESKDNENEKAKIDEEDAAKDGMQDKEEEIEAHMVDKVEDPEEQEVRDHDKDDGGVQQQHEEKRQVTTGHEVEGEERREPAKDGTGDHAGDKSEDNMENATNHNIEHGSKHSEGDVVKDPVEDERSNEEDGLQVQDGGPVKDPHKGEIEEKPAGLDLDLDHKEDGKTFDDSQKENDAGDSKDTDDQEGNVKDDHKEVTVDDDDKEVTVVEGTTNKGGLGDLQVANEANSHEDEEKGLSRKEEDAGVDHEDGSEGHKQERVDDQAEEETKGEIGVKDSKEDSKDGQEADEGVIPQRPDTLSPKPEESEQDKEEDKEKTQKSDTGEVEDEEEGGGDDQQVNFLSAKQKRGRPKGSGRKPKRRHTRGSGKKDAKKTVTLEVEKHGQTDPESTGGKDTEKGGGQEEVLPQKLSLKDAGEEKDQEGSLHTKRKRGHPVSFGEGNAAGAMPRNETDGETEPGKETMENDREDQDENLPAKRTRLPEGSSKNHHVGELSSEDKKDEEEGGEDEQDVDQTPQQSDEKEHEKDLVENLSTTTKRKPGKGSKRKLPVGGGRAHKSREENVDPKRKRGLPENLSKKGEVLDEDVNNGRNQQELDVSPPKSKHKSPKNSVDKGIEYVFNGHDKDGDMDTKENLTPKSKPGHAKASGKKESRRVSSGKGGKQEEKEEGGEQTPKHKAGRPKGGSGGKEITYPSGGDEKKAGEKDKETHVFTRRKPGQPKGSINVAGRELSSGDEKATSSAQKSPAWKSAADRGGDEGLVGCGIKVWWPLDRRFYKGEVVSYNAKKKKHKVLYDDGEQEILDLVQERWELITKKQRPVKNPPDASPTPAWAPVPLKELTKAKALAQQEDVQRPSDKVKKQSSSKSGKKSVSKEGKPNNLEAKFLEAKSPVNTISAFDFDEDDDGEAPRGGKTKRKPTQSSSTPKGSSGKIFKLVSSTKTSAKDDSSDTLGDGEPLNTWVIQRQKAH